MLNINHGNYLSVLNLSKFMPRQSGCVLFTCKKNCLFLKVMPQGGHMYVFGLMCCSLMCLLISCFPLMAFVQSRQT